MLISRKCTITVDTVASQGLILEIETSIQASLHLLKILPITVSLKVLLTNLNYTSTVMRFRL